MHWYVEVLRKYTVFSGRARRKEYWIFVLVSGLVLLLLGLVDRMMGWMYADSGYGILNTAYSIAVFIPSIAVSIRRLHDSDHSGWWMLFVFVPLVGLIVLLVLLLRNGTKGDNRFGPDPKASATW